MANEEYEAGSGRQHRSLLLSALLALLIFLPMLSGCIFDEEVKATEKEPILLNHLVMKGTHNSYHLKQIGGELIDEYNYSHAPLYEQADTYGVRQFELDVWYLPGFGLQVYHNPYDSSSSCYAFTDCLTELRNWSADNPIHVPIWIMVEAKDLTLIVDGLDILQMIEDDIDAVWSEQSIITPDSVRGESPNLRQAVLEKGWPELEESRGKAAFVLLDKAEDRDAYVSRYPGLVGAKMFAIVDQDQPEAAIISWTNPTNKGDVLRKAVEDGFIVRTRPDSATVEARESNYSRFELALDTGAHILSTDYEGVDRDIQYAIWLSDGPVMCNPVTAPSHCLSRNLEPWGNYRPVFTT